MIMLITAAVAANQSIITFLQQAGHRPNDGWLVRWGMCNLYVPQHPRNWVQGENVKEP